MKKLLFIPILCAILACSCTTSGYSDRCENSELQDAATKYAVSKNEIYNSTNSVIVVNDFIYKKHNYLLFYTNRDQMLIVHDPDCKLCSLHKEQNQDDSIFDNYELF